MSKKLVKLPTLEECGEGLAREFDTLHGLARRAKYRTIAVGLWLLKAQEVLKIKTGPKPGLNASGGEFFLTVGKNSEDDGFAAWLSSTGSHLGFSRASGYNWMTAAINAGLTATSTFEDVAHLEKTDALADRKLNHTDLYLTPGSEPAPDQKPGRIHPAVRAQETWFPFYERLAGMTNLEKELNLLNSLPLVTPEPDKEVSLGALEHRLQEALYKVREVKKQKEENERAGRRRRGPLLMDAETTDPAA